MPATAATIAANAAHRTRMQERRVRQLARTPGFTPVRNRRINDAIAAAAALLMLDGTNAADAYAAASKQIARRLPAGPMVYDWRNGLPSKNGNPEYRK